jgi:hypothetical protein
VKISILVHQTFDSIEEVERAISTTNRAQSYFELELCTASWVEKKVVGKKILDFSNLYQQKQERLGESPAVIVTKLPLKDNFVTWYEPGIYVVSLGDWEVRHQIPPIRTLLMYYIAGILPGFCSVFPEGSEEGMYHEERPIGCISDTCPRGNDDVLLSMKGARVCTPCARIYRRYGCNEKALAAARKILNYVREDAARYDKEIPYDIFISYSHQDQRFVDRLVRDLEERRLKVWRDGFLLAPDVSYACYRGNLLPAGVNLPVVHNVLAFKHVVVGMLSRCQTRMICQNPNARPNSQTVESVLILHCNHDAVLLRHLADS